MPARGGPGGARRYAIAAAEPRRLDRAERLDQRARRHAGFVGHAASKAALISLAKTLSAELLARGVRVNVTSRGPVTTPLYGKLGIAADALADTAEQIRAQVPLGRFGEPTEIAATVLHLASPESAFIVGTEIIADGGMVTL